MMYRRFATEYNRAALRSQQEVYAVPPTEYITEQTGEYRIQNNAAVGYLVYIGVNGPPDFNQPASSFSASLPIVIAWPLPGSGIQSLYIVPRYRDTYGCISQNTHPWVIRLSPSGEVLAPLPAPQSIAAYPRGSGAINVIGQYPSYQIDSNVADKIRVWVSTGVPDPTTVATHEGSFTGTPWSVGFGSYGPGTYNLVVAYYRTVDGSLSPLVSTTVTFPDLPSAPTPVFTENITP